MPIFKVVESGNIEDWVIADFAAVNSMYYKGN